MGNDDEQIKIQVYREGYEELTGNQWEGSIEDLYKTVDEIEFQSYRRDFKG